MIKSLKLKMMLPCCLLLSSVMAFGFPRAPEKTPTPTPKALEPEVPKVVCPSPLPKVKEVPRGDVYRTSPYKAGELAKYEVSYAGAPVGTGIMEVRPPARFKAPNGSNFWHRVYHLEAKTGDWYKMFFVAHDTIDSLVRPWDHGVSKFHMDQDEGKMFGRRTQQKKWLEFDHDKCVVSERTARPNKKDKNSRHDLAYGALDTLGVAFWLREQNYEIGKPVRVLTYSSEKNWWLEATPLLFEEIKVGAGTYKAVKLKLQTYIGKDLQQKGDVNIWIATEDKSRPLLLVKGEIKIGSVWIELAEFTAGKG
jgi:hypothetical protein